MSRRKKISVWIVAVLGGLLVLAVVAALALPWLSTTAPAKDKAESILSDTFGRKVSFDSMRLSLLPPRAKARGLRVQGADMNGTIGLVKVDLAVLPLFSGRLNIDSLEIQDPGLRYVLQDFTTKTHPENAALKRMGASLTEAFDSIRSSLPETNLTLHNGTIDIQQKEQPDYRVNSLNADMYIPSGRSETIQGSLQGMFATQRIPAPMQVIRARFALNQHQLLFEDLALESGKSSLESASVRLQGNGTLKVRSAAGNIGRKTSAWLKSQNLVPDWLDLDAPVSIADGVLVLQEDRTVFNSDLTMPNGLEGRIELSHTPEELDIEHLAIRDAESKASMAIFRNREKTSIDFQGKLTHKTVSGLLTSKDLQGWIEGDFRVDIPRDRLPGLQLVGALGTGGFAFTQNLDAPLKVQELRVKGTNGTVRLDSGRMTWIDADIDLSGKIRIAEKALILDLVASTGRFDWEDIQQVLHREEEGEQTIQKPDPWEQLTGVPGLDTLKGQVLLKADSFHYRDFSWKPFHVVLDVHNKSIRARLTRGALCGIQTRASVDFQTNGIEIEAEARNQPINPSLTCFLERKRMDGRFDLSSEFSTRGPSTHFLDHLQGRFRLTANNGRIYKYSVLADILAVVNITEIIKGKAPDVLGKGFGYSRAEASGTIEKGVLKLAEGFVKGKSVDLAFSGQVDIARKRMDVVVLVTPLQTVDSLIDIIPIVNTVLGENFIAIPVRVIGQWSNPAVIPISPSAVGKGLLGIVKRTLQLPITLMQPLIPDN